MKWYPIETAPRNTKIILYFVDNKHIEDGEIWEDVNGALRHMLFDGEAFEEQPKFWIPIPEFATVTEAYVLPDKTVTQDSVLAAELWAKAFYKAKDALFSLRLSTERILRNVPVRDLDETLSECDNVLKLGEN